jgi:single-strand DNA-binding protein
MAGDINRVTLVGRLTRDPELRHLPSGTPVLQLGLAVNGRQKDEAGNWTDKPNFFDVKVFGNQAEMLSMHLAKGRRVGVDGRLDWSSWEAQDGSGKRSKVEVVANTVQFLDSRADAEGQGQGQAQPQYVPQGDVAADQSDFGPSAGADDDIPF